MSVTQDQCQCGENHEAVYEKQLFVLSALSKGEDVKENQSFKKRRQMVDAAVPREKLKIVLELYNGDVKLDLSNDPTQPAI